MTPVFFVLFFLFSHLKNSNPEKKATSAELPPPAKPPQSSASLSTGAQAKQKGIPKWLKLVRFFFVYFFPYFCRLLL